MTNNEEECDELKKINLKLTLLNNLSIQNNQQQQLDSMENYLSGLKDRFYNIGAMLVALFGVLYAVYVQELNSISIALVLLATAGLFIYRLYKLHIKTKKIKGTRSSNIENFKTGMKLLKGIDDGSITHLNIEIKENHI